MKRKKVSISMGSDHGGKMLDGLMKKPFLGSSAIGRLKGLAELRDLELSIIRIMVNH